MDNEKYGKTPKRLGDAQAVSTLCYNEEFGRLLRDPAEAEKEKIQHTPCCEVCKNSRQCDGTIGTDACKFQLCDKDEMIRRVVAWFGGNNDKSSTSEDDELCDKMIDVLRKVYHEPTIKIYSECRCNQPCPKCDGSGIYLGASGIAACEYCNGTGLIPRTLEPGFHYVYSVFTWRTGGDCYHNCFVEDEKNAIEMVNHYNRINRDIRTDLSKDYMKVILSDRLTGVDLGFISGADGEAGESLVVIDTEINVVVTTGDWETICANLGNAPYVDIEYATSGKYIVESLRNYNAKYCVMTTAFADELYSHVFSNIAASITQYSSYNGVENLVIRYIEKYPTIQDVRNNLSKHLALQASQMYAVSGEYQKVINKIIKDFSLIGMAITRADAATIVDKSQLTTDEYIVIYNIEQYSAVGVFLAEYVLLLGEFSDLTDDDKEVN